jgi:hypothetical protein
LRGQTSAIASSSGRNGRRAIPRGEQDKRHARAAGVAAAASAVQAERWRGLEIEIAAVDLARALEAEVAPIAR